MTGRVYFILASTFLMGVLAGAYLYVTVFAPSYEAGIQTGENIDEDTLVIMGDMYGGCSRLDACASFRLVGGRDYDYLSHPQADVREGRLSARLENEIKNALDPQTLAMNTKPISASSCDSYVDGIDYAYRISYEGRTYELDTCQTALAYDQYLQSLLIEIWRAMENPQEANESGVNIDVSDLIEERLQGHSQE